MKLKAGALSYALFVGVVTAILCFLMLSLVFFNRRYFQQLDKQEKLLDNCRSGIVLGLAQQDTGSRWVDLFGEETDSVRVTNRYWGLYKLVSAQARFRTYRKERSAIFGYFSSQSNKVSLILPERDRPINLAGDALIKGDAYLPKKGLETAYIEGKNYSRDKRLYGQKQNSSRRLHEIESNLLETAKERLSQLALEGDSVVSLEYQEHRKHQSFTKNTLVSSNEGVLTIKERFSGNMVIKATGEINVKATASLDNVVLIAPIIRIQNGFSGSLQLIASDSIVLGKQTHLRYPSSITLLSKSQNDEGQVHIKEGAEFSGLIVYESNLRSDRNQASVKLDAGGLVKGQVYSNKLVEIRGELEGTLFANGFILITKTGVYQNHLLDGKLDRSKLTENFAGLPIDSWDNQPELIAWL